MDSRVQWAVLAVHISVRVVDVFVWQDTPGPRSTLHLGYNTEPVQQFVWSPCFGIRMHGKKCDSSESVAPAPGCKGQGIIASFLPQWEGELLLMSHMVRHGSSHPVPKSLKQQRDEATLHPVSSEPTYYDTVARRSHPSLPPDWTPHWFNEPCPLPRPSTLSS